MAGGGGSGVQQTKPPEYQLPYLKHGLQQSQDAYHTGTPTAPLSSQTLAGVNQITQRAGGGDPTINAATGYVQDSLGGKFLNSNPYLDQTFNKAALSTQNQLSSEFAKYGRDVQASEPLRAQQLNDLATSIYGGNYQAERDRMQGTLGYAQPLGNQAYTDANALLQSGGILEEQNQREIDAPGNALDKYLARIRGTDYGQTQTTRNPRGSPLAGAAGGAAMGSMFGPWGTAIGALGGAIFG